MYNELIEKYCYNCEIGLYFCPYIVTECPLIKKKEQGDT